jgi:hypothetical protein
MNKFAEIKRTACTAWSPQTNMPPMLATGTVSGAMDANFSSSTELEIWKVDGNDACMLLRCPRQDLHCVFVDILHCDDVLNPPFN